MIKNNILAEFLSTHRAEVCEMILTEYDEELHIACEKEISKEEGLEEGIRAMILDNLEGHVSEERIIQKLQKYFSLDYKKAAGYLENTKNGSNVSI